MFIAQYGKAVKPQEYCNWQVEMTGDTDDSGGVYVVLFHPTKNKPQKLFWDTTQKSVLAQLDKQGIEIIWA